MNEIYWITVLGNISLLLVILCLLLGIYIAVAIIVTLAETYDDADFVENVNKFKLKFAIPLCIIFGFISCFIPSEKQLYMIFGVGSVIDYVQDSKKLKELPDNAINALDIWIEKLNEK